MAKESSPSTAIKLAQIVFAVFFCLTCAGVIFGFAALKPVLVAEGVYSDLCLPGERQRDPITGLWNICEDQDTRLNAMFTIASGVTNVACLPIGYTLDRLGPKKTSLIGAVLFALGNFAFGIGYRGFIDTYVLGFILLALGGPLIFLPSFNLSNAFPAYSGLILSAVTGAFDASSIPYVIYRAIYDQVDGGVGVRTFFWGYMILPAIVIVEQLLLAPSETYQREVAGVSLAEEEELEAEETQQLSAEQAMAAAVVAMNASSFSRIHYGDLHANEEGMVKAQREVKGDSLTGLLYGLGAADQIKSPWFWALTLFVCVHMARINFYILSCFAQLNHYTNNPALAETLTRTFTVLLPLGGVVGVPFVGFLLDTRPWIDAVKVLLLFGLAFGLFGITHLAATQIVGIAFFVLFRPLMYTAVSDGFAKIFGFVNFGTVYGLAMTISGLTGLINAPLDVLVKTRLEGNFSPVDLTFIGLGVLSTCVLLVMVWRATRNAAIQLP